ncbi:hypothetical protein [Actinoplanes siamensis]|uniref:Uncharacterized protein n=1 Tax=Actinoplanes siamensis TaxID=1223317 RepID=A0A919N6W0_9ACTN|nr:hypothetical protein [Actinoplanes siamensis]GIF05463.1 hypothetical protein Asi03nite_30010 [Actinoplanes siamensis]
MTPEEPPRNPFRNTGALRPWEDESADEQLYVAVDHTLEQFRRFVAYLSDPPRDIRSRGRLIVVTGGRGSGKTSLIHRCVNHVKNKVPGGKLKIVDVTRHQRLRNRGPEGSGPDNFQDNYFDRLTHHVLTEMNGLSERYTDPGSNIGPAASAYSRLASSLRREGDLAAILLPAFLDQVSSPSDTTDAEAEAGAEAGELIEHPVESYMQFRNKGIIFFAESRNPVAMAAWYKDLDADAQAETIVLTLGPLKPGDGWRFARERLKDVTDQRVPIVREETMTNLLANGRSMTLSHLGQLCSELWNAAIARGSLEITDEDIARFYERQADTLQRRPRPDDVVRSRPVERRDDETTDEADALEDETDDE